RSTTRRTPGCPIARPRKPPIAGPWPLQRWWSARSWSDCPPPTDDAAGKTSNRPGEARAVGWEPGELGGDPTPFDVGSAWGGRPHRRLISGVDVGMPRDAQPREQPAIHAVVAGDLPREHQADAEREQHGVRRGRAREQER